MDLDFFLKERTKFIRYFFEAAFTPFSNIKRAIENKEEPYIPQYSEDEEPPFLSEWLDADTGEQTICHACISMLSASLKLFLDSWMARFKKDHTVFKVNFKKYGWFGGYMKVLKNMEVDLAESRVNISILEQIALARNRIQHPDHIATLNVSYTKSDIKKYPNPYFIKQDQLLTTEDSGEVSWLMVPPISATREKVFEAIEEVERFCCWLENIYNESRRA